MSYIVISISEDGDVRVYQHKNAEPILHELEESGQHAYWLDHIPDPDPNYWGAKTDTRGTHHLVIKGEIVTPHPVEKITKYELP